MNPDNAERLRGLIASFNGMTDDEKVEEAAEMMEQLRDTIRAMADIRTSAMRDLRRDSSLQELADRFGLSPQRIAQILDR